MKKITAALILMAQVHLAGAAPELIDMAANENYFSADFVAALKPLTKEQINEQRDILGRSILHILAIRSHQARALPTLLAGADANAKDNDGRNPLFDVLEAADSDSKGNADIMLLEMLTLRGADVNARARMEALRC